MFQVSTQSTKARGAVGLAGHVYHATVRSVQQTHRNALVSLILSILQTVVFVIAFLILFNLLGLRGAAIRGDYLLYIMTGIFVYITHIKTVSAVMGSEGPASPMMQHAPMNTFIAISASALSTLYIQVLSLLIILSVYHIAFTPITIHVPTAAMAMLILAWFLGVAVGMIFFALKPWMPGVVGVLSMIYMRVNMIASGKMFVANSLPSSKLGIFDWNPLFHIIDQIRGFTFLHYNPHFSSWEYALKIALVLLLIGLMGEFYTRRQVSPSWSAGR